MIVFIVFPFLAVGCGAFLLCAAIPPLRRYALSSSLWCVACVPCLLAILAATILWSAGIAALKQFFDFDLLVGVVHFHQTSWQGWLLTIATLIITIAGATAITLVHGIITRRLTLALFRLYLVIVSFGVGILTCFFVLLALATHLVSLIAFVPAGLISLFAASALAYACFKNASDFRGSYPQRLSVVTPEEFGQI